MKICAPNLLGDFDEKVKISLSREVRLYHILVYRF